MREQRILCFISRLNELKADRVDVIDWRGERVGCSGGAWWMVLIVRAAEAAPYFCLQDLLLAS